jgi:hypothetical protein
MNRFKEFLHNPTNPVLRLLNGITSAPPFIISNQAEKILALGQSVLDSMRANLINFTDISYAKIDQVQY